MSKKLEFEFQFLVKCGAIKEFEKQLVIPNIVGNLFPQEDMFCMNLVDSRGKTHKVFATRLDDGSCLLSGSGWKKFVKSDPYKQFGTVCFTWKEDCMFGVQVFCTGGLEYRRMMQAGDSAVNSQLVVAKDYTFHQVVLSPCLLHRLNKNMDHDWQYTTVVFGRKENAKVTVSYQYYELDGMHAKMAYGFEGVGWRNFCSNNNLYPGYILKFSKNVDLTFTIDVFAQDGSLVDVHGDVFSVNKETNLWPPSSDDEARPELKYHKCRYIHAAHSGCASHCFQKILHQHVERNQLSVPKFFVIKHKLFNYDDGVLHFGEMVFPFHLVSTLDGSRPGDLSYMVMIMDWSYFMTQTGVEEDDIIRFQFNEDDNVEGETLHLDVC